MKRSEYVREVLEQAKVPGAWFVVPFGSINQLPVGVHTAELLAERLADLQSAAGVVWDPEEEPLPERLEAVYNVQWMLVVPLPARSGWPQTRFLSEREATEAARRYNAWPELESIVSELPDDDTEPDPCRFSCKLYAIRRVLRGGAS